MDEDARFAAAELRLAATQLLGAAGLPQAMAATVADVLLEADLMGHTTHGLALLPDYLGELDRGGMAKSGEPTIVATAPAATVWDGNRLPGPWLVKRAIEHAVERAAETGSHAVTVRRSHHIACLAAYLKPVTDRGLMIVLASSDPNTASVAPFGGTVRLITPNPLAAGIPTGGDPILIDVSMSTTTNAMTARARTTGQRLPQEWILDAQGRPTSDPEAFFADPPGSILPLGGTELGYKGFALGLLIEALTGGLAGHGRADPREGWGASFFLQIHDPARFAGRAAFERQMAALAAAARTCPPAPGHERVRLPGQRALARRASQLAQGVALDPSILPRLRPWAERYAVPLPSGWRE